MFIADSTCHAAPSCGGWAPPSPALPRRDDAGRRDARAGPPAPERLIAIEMVHGAAGSTAYGIKKNMWAPAATGSRFDLIADQPRSLEPYRDYLTIVSNTDVPQRRGVCCARNRRRSLPHRRRLPDPEQAEADAGLGRLRRHVARPDLRADVRPGHADSLDAALHRERGSGGRVLVQLLLRLHRHDQLVVANRSRCR